MTDSVGLLSDAMESGVTWVSAVFALKHGDDRHADGRRPTPSANTKASILQRLRRDDDRPRRRRISGCGPAPAQPQPLQPLQWGLALAVLASAPTVSCRGHDAQRAGHRSIALEADARHLMTDVVDVGGVVGGCCS